MQIGMIGLGRMGSNMTRRLMRGGHECVVYDVDYSGAEKLATEGAAPARTLNELVEKLSPPRAVWMMVPSGEATENCSIRDMGPRLGPGDALIDGGNSYFKDSVRRSKLLWEKQIDFVDVGTSGGVWGLERGYCLMIGGPENVVQRLDPIFRTLAPGDMEIEPTYSRRVGSSTADLGYLHCGPSGAGHFVKMIHNGIEYGMMQAFGEGFDLLKCAARDSLPEDHRFEFNLPDIAEVWRRGSVVGSWLLDLASTALHEDPELSSFSGIVGESGEGRWTVMTAIEEKVPVDVLAAALFTRFRSQQEHTFSEKMLSALRKQFGGHVEPGTQK